MIITTSNINEAKKQINKSQSNSEIRVMPHNLEFNRNILEYGKFHVFLGLDQRFNHIMAKIATKNKITIALDLRVLQILTPKEKARKLSHIIQNIKFCRKAKTKIALLNTDDPKDAREFLLSLGASTLQAKNIAS